MCACVCVMDVGSKASAVRAWSVVWVVG